MASSNDRIQYRADKPALKRITRFKAEHAMLLNHLPRGVQM